MNDQSSSANNIKALQLRTKGSDFLRILGLCIASLVFLVPQLTSQNVQWVGIDSRIGNQMAHKQDDSEWCWAASAQMILNFYGLPVSQEAIVQKIHGNQENRAGSDDDITAALNGWAPFPGGRKVVHAAAQDGFPTAPQLIRELSQGKPILIAFSTGPNSGHAVVITGAAFSQTYNGVLIRALVIRDPWPSPQNVANSGRVEYDDFNLYAFSQTVRKYWTVAVSLEPVSPQTDLGQSSDSSPRPSDESCSGKYDSCIEKAQTQQQSCMSRFVQGCMLDCRENYGYTAYACQTNFCSVDNSGNSQWTETCESRLDLAKHSCERKQTLCER